MLKVIVIESEGGIRAAMRRMLTQAHATVVAEYETVTEAYLSVASHRPDLVIVEVTDDSAATDVATARAIERLARTLPDSTIVATGPIHSAELVIQIMRAGALEYLKRPVDGSDLSAVLAKVGRTRRASAPPARISHITALFSASGGVGVTTLAITLGMALADNAAKRVLLLELDTRPSDVMTFLDIRPPYSVEDALQNLDRMDESFIQGVVVKYDNGLSVLTAPPGVASAPLDSERVQMMLEILRSHFDHIVIDCRHDFDAGTLAALDASDTILLLVAPNVGSIRSGAAALAAFRQSGVDTAKVRAVISRERTGIDVDAKHVKETLGLSVFWATPNDYASTVAAINHGRPLSSSAPRSKLMANVRGLAEKLPTMGKPSASRRKPSLLRRLSWK
jgi:pilus assembly protein CpaE